MNTHPCCRAQILFSFELTVACIVRPGYFASLYFWIDLAATLSMLLDITSAMDLVFHQDSFAGTSPLERGNQNKACLIRRPPCVHGLLSRSTPVHMQRDGMHGLYSVCLC
jgi:hypothetical protein